MGTGLTANRGSGQFTEVVLGKTAEVREGVAFSLVCKYSAPAEKPAEATTAAPPQS